MPHQPTRMDVPDFDAWPRTHLKHSRERRSSGMTADLPGHRPPVHGAGTRHHRGPGGDRAGACRRHRRPCDTRVHHDPGDFCLTGREPLRRKGFLSGQGSEWGTCAGNRASPMVTVTGAPQRAPLGAGVIRGAVDAH
jgi:hypothetical protein